MNGNFAQNFAQDLSFLDGKSVLITGGTGSFGKALVRRILEGSEIARIVVFSRDEFKQFEMEHMFPPERFPQLRFFIGDVRDEQRLTLALSGIDYVFHAAALKQVPAAEYNPFECIKTNVIGAENTMRASLSTSVKHVVALSTDKAAAPINLYGASKLASDKIFVAANHMGVPSGTSFCVVRYGNVVGSRGSVIPFFQKQLEQNAGFLPITHPEMTRFLITIEQGVNFSLSVLKNMIETGVAGDIFVPKLPSISIMQLAQVMAPELEHKLVGVRPGEKIHEEMVTQGDALNTVDLGDRYVIEPFLARFARPEHAELGGNKVPENFRYDSGSNNWFLTDHEVAELVATHSAG
ncbi:UDP-N-acetylglucosamine 4,6-dehydratase (inverting) [Ruegeria conchae]|uniref:UDP-N-acetylglucosamine 4,6-dehydratase (inverting) n=1 Tax=Ruegeria conchae TaxID=981384 RepID=UPI00147A3E48|nr:UDP-N-acetylglucosamine 4,6-dehydratase (inverting) [Ruegeria conchae]UWR01964.1 UDP-N-acetylglucosamine 4,6-dehydratase (inverting) [Ruegeria conchae]